MLCAQVLLNAHSFPKLQFGSVSEEAKAAINEMLVVDPKHRPTAAALLRHSWLQPDELGKGSPEKASGSLATSYHKEMRNLMRAAKRARAAESERVHASVGASSVGSSVFGSCSFREGAAAMGMSRHGSVGKEHARKPHEPKAARRAPHRVTAEAQSLEDGAEEEGLGFFRPFGTTDAVSVDAAGSTLERDPDPPHPGMDVLDM